MDQLDGRPSPVLVLGMHRSGTSVVSRLLQSGGINMGARQDSNAESMFFVRLNSWILGQTGASWASVDHVDEMVSEHIEMLEPIARRRIQSVAAIEHFGRSRRDSMWGFKDPRSCLLFPLYERIFPGCRVVIVNRHGVDVAESLRARSAASLDSVGPSMTAPLLGVRQPRANRLQNAVVASDLERNLRLWAAYQQVIDGIDDLLPADRIFRLRFEDLVEDSPDQLAALSEFVGAQVPPAELVSARAYAHRRSPELARFAQEHATQLRRFGY